MSHGIKLVSFRSFKERFDSLVTLQEEINKDREGLVSMICLLDDDLDYDEKESEVTKEVDKAFESISLKRDKARSISENLITAIQQIYLDNIDDVLMKSPEENWVYELRVEKKDCDVLFARCFDECDAINAFIEDKASKNPKGYNALSRFRINNVRTERIDCEDYDFDSKTWSTRKTISRIKDDK